MRHAALLKASPCEAVFDQAAIDLEALRPAAKRILDVQTASGAIPWFEQGAWDPWNHTESAMALTIMGYTAQADAAYRYLMRTQGEDGSWLGEYGNALPIVKRDYISREPAKALIDSNFCAYPAVGVAHYFQVTGDYARLCDWWPMVKRALDFVLTLRRPDGTISWSYEAQGTDRDDALLAGNASIVKSLECGIVLAQEMGEPCGRWRDTRASLCDAIQSRPCAFDQSGEGKRFAMDWYYPVLAGVFAIDQARARLAQKWPTFVDDDYGCRCVCDEPWVTIAETAELVLALLVVGDVEQAHDLFDRLGQYRDAKGAFWMGWQTAEAITWPKEQPSWTQAAVILAADALNRVDAGGNILTGRAAL